MTDKLRKTQPLKVSFSEGEQPTAAKLSVMATQTRQGSAILEYAIGDLWNQSGDEVMIDFPLQIPNLARLLGQNQYLNPAMYPIMEDFTYYEDIGAAYAGRTEGYLKFRPKTNAIASQTGTQFTNPVAEERLVGDPVDSGGINEFWLDIETGRFRIDAPLVGSEVISYVVDPTVYEDTDDVLPGIIPDPRQGEFTGVKVTQDTLNRDLIVLPPRRPLTWGATPDTFNGSQARPSSYPSDADILLAGNYETTTSLPKRYWNDTGTAVVDEHYRYHLPKEILDAYSTMSPGDSYPAGAMYLWDTVTQTIVEGIVFKKPTDGTITDRWVIEIDTSGSDFTFPAPTSKASEAEADYNTGLVLITCGSPMARNVFNILARQLNHSHDGGDFTNKVPHSSLDGLNPPDSGYTDHSARYPTNLPRWSPSRWAFDGHTSLLSRAGSYGDSHARRRDPNDNAMLGDLVLANSVADSNNVFLDPDCPDNSFSIYFGSATGGTRLYVGSTGLKIVPRAGSNDIGLEVAGIGAGAGIIATAVSAHGVSASTDSGSKYGLYGTGTVNGAGGVYGVGNGSGMGGRFSSTSGYGVYSTTTSGVAVNADSSTGWGLQASSFGNYGVYATTGSVNHAAVYGTGATNGTGILGFGGASGTGTGVRGVAGYGGGIGVNGRAKGAGTGMYGEADITVHDSTGIHGIVDTTTFRGIAIKATNNSSDSLSVAISALSTGAGPAGSFSSTTVSGNALQGTVGVGLAGVAVQGNHFGTGVAVQAAAQSTGIALSASSKDNIAVRGYSETGYAGWFQGHASGGGSGKAALHIDPQAAAPNGPNVVGDIYVDTSGILWICTVAGTPGTWTKVGTQT